MDVPEISVVIPAVNGARFLRGTLRALARQPRPQSLEILVVDRLEPGEAASLLEEFPYARILQGRGLTIPRMRWEGIRPARAAIVAVLDDHMEVKESWQDAIRRGHSSDAVAVGGPIANGCDSSVDWAAFLIEYSEFMPPMSSGPASSLPGSNIAYKRSVIAKYEDLLRAGLWETFVHEALARRGLTFRCEAEAEVVHTKPFSASHFASQRWHLARSYAGMRARRLSILRRLICAAAAPLLVPWRAGRIARHALSRPAKSYRRALWRCLPWLLLFLIIWGGGDVAGYIVGEGDSTLRVL